MVFTQVYEDDIRRNYFMVKELLIALAPTISGGLPWLRDFEASGNAIIYNNIYIYMINAERPISWPTLFGYIRTP